MRAASSGEQADRVVARIAQPQRHDAGSSHQDWYEKRERFNHRPSHNAMGGPAEGSSSG